MMDNTSFLTVAAPVAAQFNHLTAGCYDAVCCAFTVKEMPNYARTATEQKLFFTYQVVDGDTKHYVRTKPIRNINNDKSALVEIVGGWLKKSGAELAGLQYNDLVGKPAQIVVTEESKNGKTYVKLTQVLPPKANASTAVVADDAVPSFVTDGTIYAKLADGLAVRQQAQQIADTKPQPFNPINVNAVSNGNDGLPF